MPPFVFNRFLEVEAEMAEVSTMLADANGDAEMTEYATAELANLQQELEKLGPGLGVPYVDPPAL